MSELANFGPSELVAAATDLLEREAAYLDERRWDDWLDLFTEDCEYWMPAWRGEDQLTENPQAELSHFYFAGRAGLEDRIVRIRTGQSPASSPLPRTTHLLGNVIQLEPPTSEEIRLRHSWVCHVYFVRSRDTHAFFGHSEVTLACPSEQWLIARKKIVMQNDHIPTMLDFYMV